MSIDLIGSSLVVAANRFNPSVFSEHWLVTQRLLSEGECAPGYIFSDAIVQAKTPKFALFIVPEQLQFSPNPELPDQQSLIVDIIGGIVRGVPHTPYTAIGFNFAWHVTPDDGDMKALSRHLFFRPGSPLFHEFDTEDGLFGAYLSRNAFGCRLRLDIKPIAAANAARGRRDMVQFAFNFNRDLSGPTAVTEIEEMLAHWNQAKDESERIVRLAREDV